MGLLYKHGSRYRWMVYRLFWKVRFRLSQRCLPRSSIWFACIHFWKIQRCIDMKTTLNWLYNNLPIYLTLTTWQRIAYMVQNYKTGFLHVWIFLLCTRWPFINWPILEKKWIDNSVTQQSDKLIISYNSKDPVPNHKHC